ncbi:hypothetical protein LMIY3S_02126 [Labrys miyagiensis]
MSQFRARLRRDRLLPAARLAAAMAATLVAGGVAMAQTQPDPNWPCVQRKVGTLSAGVVWSGPDIASAGPWDKDFDAAALAQKLASRRTPLDDVDGLLDGFLQQASADKGARLTRVFAGVLELVNDDRDAILAGIDRYAHGQQRLAERIRDESDQISAAKDSPGAATTKETDDLETQLKWDTRIFQERSRSLTYVCETPVLLERRLFDIARRIQQRL